MKGVVVESEYVQLEAEPYSILEVFRALYPLWQLENDA
jgi:hypothetical protein